MKGFLTLATSVLLAACGGAADSSNVADAGAGACTMIVQASPQQPVVGDTVVLTASIDRQGDVWGIEHQEWAVLDNMGQPVSIVESAPDMRAVAFDASVPGTYRAVLSGWIDDLACADASMFMNATLAGARMAQYRLRAVPLAEQAVPAQDIPLEVRGGADAYLGTMSLAGGSLTQGAIVDATGQGTAAYVRAQPSFGPPSPLVHEGFAGPDGQFSLRLMPVLYDVLVVPDSNAWAPVRMAGVRAKDLATVTVGPGQAVAGVVVDSTDAPVAGARVSMRVAGVPSTMATTGPDGAFTVRAQQSGPIELTVVPPVDSGLLTLEVARDAGLLADGASLTIRYAPRTTRAVAVPLRLLDGATPAPGARITWIARPVQGAATVTAGSANVPAQGSMRRSQVASDSGDTTEIVLAEAMYDVIVEPAPDAGPDQSVALRQVDVSAGQATPGFLALAPPARLTGSTLKPGPDGGAPVAAGSIEVMARPTGLLARSTAASAHTVSASNGTFSLNVAGSGTYDISWKDPGSAVRVWSTVAAPGAGQTLGLSPAELPATITLSGHLALPLGSGSAAGVHLMLLCDQCAGVDGQKPIAETVTSTSGAFTLAVPDPGVDTSLATRTGGR